jgi:hypothetical protein
MNRYATQQDADIYNQLVAPRVITPELDYIFHLPTKIGEERIWVTKAGEFFKDLKNGATIWFTPSSLRQFQAMILTNESGLVSKLKWPQVDTVNFGIIPEEQWMMKRGVQSYANIPFKINGVKHMNLQFTSPLYPMWDTKVPFQRDLCPLFLSSSGYYNHTGHPYWFVAPNGGSIKVDGLGGGDGSFSVLRPLADNQHGYVSGEIKNIYTVEPDGESIYASTTDAGVYTALKNFVIDQFLSVRAAAEFQLQHCQGVQLGKIYLYNSGFKFPVMQRNWQDSATQFVVDCGKNYIQSICIDQFVGSNALNFMGAAPYVVPETGQPNFTVQPGDEFVIEQAYIYGGHLGVYLHQMCKFGITWRIKKLYIGGMNDDYALATGTRPVDYYLKHDGTDKIKIDTIIHDGSRPKIAQDGSKFEIGIILGLKPEEFPRPKYKFNQNVFINWEKFVANYHPNPDGTRMRYKAGQYVTDREHGFPCVHLVTLKDHVAHDIRPKNDPEYFKIITYDNKALPSNHPNWNIQAEQRPYAGDNMTHTDDSPLKEFTWLVAEPEVEQARMEVVGGKELFAVTATKRYKVGYVEPVN